MPQIMVGEKSKLRMMFFITADIARPYSAFEISTVKIFFKIHIVFLWNAPMCAQ
jgi:hypothetical protein